MARTPAGAHRRHEIHSPLLQVCSIPSKTGADTTRWKGGTVQAEAESQSMLAHELTAQDSIP